MCQSAARSTLLVRHGTWHKTSCKVCVQAAPFKCGLWMIHKDLAGVVCNLAGRSMSVYVEVVSTLFGLLSHS